MAGAFDGIDKIIEKRSGAGSIGFGAEVKSREKRNVGEILADIRPEDLLKFGLIPEFVGRLPIIVTLDNLDEDALVRILTEPRNALVRQYKKLVELDGVELDFEDEALKAIAAKAIARKSGARGLRAIIEDALLNTMFELPTAHGHRARDRHGRHHPGAHRAYARARRAQAQADGGQDEARQRRRVGSP